ncbi:MAG: hypothetical protein CL533_14770 [Afipia sp.]|nr:hypothetical protein [Afipia sp.]OUX60306.1 MAG: hypothetical protein CBB64_14720 [Afipia sp. TMED4]HAQ94269.1 hypothetical protein [Afipia sp.]HCX19432.1 hypothetical protein [Afipia sp.]
MPPVRSNRLQLRSWLWTTRPNGSGESLFQAAAAHSVEMTLQNGRAGCVLRIGDCVTELNAGLAKETEAG